MKSNFYIIWLLSFLFVFILSFFRVFVVFSPFISYIYVFYIRDVNLNYAISKISKLFLLVIFLVFCAVFLPTFAGDLCLIPRCRPMLPPDNFGLTAAFYRFQLSGYHFEVLQEKELMSFMSQVANVAIFKNFLLSIAIYPFLILSKIFLEIVSRFISRKLFTLKSFLLSFAVVSKEHPAYIGTGFIIECFLFLFRCSLLFKIYAYFRYKEKFFKINGPEIVMPDMPGFFSNVTIQLVGVESLLSTYLVIPILLVAVCVLLIGPTRDTAPRR